MGCSNVGNVNQIVLPAVTIKGFATGTAHQRIWMLRRHLLAALPHGVLPRGPVALIAPSLIISLGATFPKTPAKLFSKWARAWSKVAAVPSRYSPGSTLDKSRIASPIDRRRPARRRGTRSCRRVRRRNRRANSPDVRDKFGHAPLKRSRDANGKPLQIAGPVAGGPSAIISQCGYSIDEKAFVISFAIGSRCTNPPDISTFPTEQPRFRLRLHQRGGEDNKSTKKVVTPIWRLIMAASHLRGLCIGRESDFSKGSRNRPRQPWAERTQFRLIVSVEVTYGHLLTHGSRRLNYDFADSRVKKHGRRSSHISRSSSYGGRHYRQGIRMAPRRSVWAVHRSTDEAKQVIWPSGIDEIGRRALLRQLFVNRLSGQFWRFILRPPPLKLNRFFRKWNLNAG
jgi:hypothetical protein